MLVLRRLVGGAALGYAGLLALPVWQAGRGQSLIHPDAITLTAFATLVALSTAGAALTVATARAGQDMRALMVP